jgi:DNA-binding transcriptional regulator GbsR (MarR family)
LCDSELGEEEKKILDRLLTDEVETLKNLVNKAEKYLKISKHTGEPIINLPREKISMKDLVALHVAGRYFAFKLGLTSTETITLEELKNKTGISNEKLLAARVSELRKEGLIEYVRKGVYRISLPNLSRFFDQLGEKYGSK